MDVGVGIKIKIEAILIIELVFLTYSFLADNLSLHHLDTKFKVW